MAGKKFTVSMDLNNIEPHHGVHKFSFSEEMDSNKTVFYATNGTGKSFISRAFRLCEPSKADTMADEVLTIGEQSGFFSFGIQDDHVDKELEVSLQRGKSTIVKNSSEHECGKCRRYVLYGNLHRIKSADCTEHDNTSGS